MPLTQVDDSPSPPTISDVIILVQTFQTQSPSAVDVNRVPAAAADGTGRRLPQFSIGFNSIPSAIAVVASQIYMAFLLYIPSLYSSRIQPIRVGAARDNLRATESEHAMESCHRLSRILVKEWAALRILSGLVLATILSMFQISGTWGNQLMMVAALFSFASLIYGAILTIYVNGWRDDSGVPMWVESIRSPFEIGFLWNTWILLGLPAICATWGVVLFFLSMMLRILTREDDSDAQNLVPVTSSQPARPTMPPRFAAAHPWCIPLSAVAMVYLMLLMYTLWGLGRRQQSTDCTLTTV